MQEVRCPPIPERMSKSIQKQTFRTTIAENMRFGALFWRSLELAETSLLAQIDVLAVWALWLELKYTSVVWLH